MTDYIKSVKISETKTLGWYEDMHLIVTIDDCSHLDKRPLSLKSDCSEQEPLQVETMEDEKPRKRKSNGLDMETPEEILIRQKRHDRSVISLPLNDSSEFEITQQDLDAWKKIYTGVNVEEQLEQMKELMISNPVRRKTRRGIRVFIRGWLSRKQDNGGLVPVNNVTRM
jgi:hypothetical protein